MDANEHEFGPVDLRDVRISPSSASGWSPAVQAIIGEFRRAEYGEPLFIPDAAKQSP